MEFDRDKFYKTLLEEDDVGRVIRTFIYIETLLFYFIGRFLASSDHIKGTEFTFEHKIKIALALGLTPELGKSIKAFGNLRNKFAHNLEASLEKDTVGNLCNTLPSRGKRMMEQMHQHINSTREEHLKEPPMNQLNPKDKFTLFSVSVINMLAAEIIPLDRDNVSP